MRRKKFIRHKWRTYSKLGRGRRKKMKYRKPRGRHNKMGARMKGNPRFVAIGFKKTDKEDLKTISQLKDLHKLKKGEKVILERIGKKKKIEIAKKAKEMGIEIQNLNIKKFMKKIEAEIKKKEPKKEKLKEESKDKELKK